MIISFKMALRSISSNKMRAALTMLGIIIGVMALVVLVSLVNGATSSVTDAVSGLGTSMLTVSILVPRPETASVTELVAPFTKLTKTTSAITPMIMPSIVSAARILLEVMERSAILKEIITASPP